MSLKQPREGQDRRQLQRMPQGSFLGFRLEVEVQDGRFFDATLVELHALGLSAKVDGDFSLSSDLKFKKISVFFGKALVSSIPDPQVISTVSEKGVFSLSFINKGRLVKSLRRHRVTPKGHLGTAVFCLDPFKPGRILHFNVENFNSSGVSISTSLSNKHLVPGVKLSDCTFLFPGLGPTNVDLQITNATVSNKRMTFGAFYIDPPPSFLSRIASYAIFGVSREGQTLVDLISSLGQSGFPLKKLLEAATSNIVDEPKLYYEVLRVRHHAYMAAAKLKSDTTVGNMADEFDSHSVNFAARLNEAVAGAVRIVRCEKVGDRFPFESHFPFPDYDRTTCVEVSRLALHPLVQGTDLVLVLFRSVLDYLTKAGIPNVFCVATKTLEQMYLKMGAELVSGPVPHPILQGETMSLFLISTKNMITGLSMDPKSWAAISKDVVSLLSLYGFTDKFQDTKDSVLQDNIKGMILRGGNRNEGVT